MDITTLISKLPNNVKITKLSPKEYEIKTGAAINDKTPIKMHLLESNGKFKFVDKKNILKYMNNVYELKSLDVKNCIVSVIKIYGFSIIGGELHAEIKSEDKIVETFYNFIICCGQLANMYAFFDKPE